MSMGTIGVEVSGRNATEIVAQIQRLEDLGVKAAWATSGGDSDPITLLAVAAVADRVHSPRHIHRPNLAPPPNYHRTTGKRPRPSGPGPLSSRDWTKPLLGNV